MRTHLAPLRLLACLPALLLTACAVGPNYQRPTPPPDRDYGSAPIQGETSSAQGVAGSAQQFALGQDVPAQWWTLFQSDRLSQLVQQAFAGNADVAAARAALRQAHELYLSQRASLFPLVQGGLSATRDEYATNAISNPTVASSNLYSLYTAQLSLTYVPDVFGGTRRAIETARAQRDYARYELRAAYLTLSSNVVVTAIQEASLRAQIGATQQLLQVEQQLTATVQQQRTLGTASELDLLSQQSARAQLAATLPPLQKQLGQTRDALSALLGRLPAQEPQATFVLTDLVLPTQLPVSLPSSLIEQRPDVRAAEENLHAASAQVGVALANMLPQFAINGDIGSASLTLAQLFGRGNGFWDIGASLTQTLFDAGALLHKKRAADAALDQAGAQYRSAVVNACQNVADTLRALQADADALKASVEADRASKATLELASQQYRLGSISQVVLLSAQQNYQQAELTLAQAQGNRLTDTAALFQALGGGWWNRPAGSTP